MLTFRATLPLVWYIVVSTYHQGNTENLDQKLIF